MHSVIAVHLLRLVRNDTHRASVGEIKTATLRFEVVHFEGESALAVALSQRSFPSNH